MLMSQLAMFDPRPSHSTLLERCRRAIARFFGFGEVPPELRAYLRPEPPLDPPAPGASEPRLRIVSDMPTSPPPAPSLRWRRHPQLRDRPISALPQAQREARQHAVRALYAARTGDLSTARAHFAQAAREPSLDLCEVPGFWTLPRAALVAAAEAYEEAGRVREASALHARIRTMFRPRALRPVPGNVTELPRRRLTASGGS